MGCDNNSANHRAIIGLPLWQNLLRTVSKEEILETMWPKALGWQKHLRWAIPLLFGLMATLVTWGNPLFPYWGVGAAIVIAASMIGVLLTPAIAKRMSEF